MPHSLERKRINAQKKRTERRAYAKASLGGKCVECGVTENLEFDHIDPSSKIINVSALWTCRMDRFLDELKKCQLLCKDCHTQKTIKDLYPERKHGTRAMYSRGGCRCEECKEAQSIYMKKYNRLYRRRNP